MLNDGQVQILEGNLGRDWESKTVNVGGTDKTLWESSVALSNGKDAPATWVNLTVWPSRDDNSDAEGRAFAEATGRGSKVMVVGKVKVGSYVNKQGETVTKNELAVYRLAKRIMPPRDGAAAVQAAFPGATEHQYEDKTMEPF
jgi:single-stranded DNA-binding protein